MENEEDESYIDMFGEIVYKMDFSKAIENNYICDYKIWLPSIHEDNIDLNEELTIYEINDVIKSKCNFLYSCLLNNGSKKIIIYSIDTKEIKKIKEAINILNDFYCLEYDIQQITSEDSERKRTKILKNFSENEKIQLLFSVRILDECIDIQKCDSIYITYPTQSKIRTIQRICRCLRIDKNNKFKIGNIYIWCSEYDSILETLSGIKEYDMFFKDKIKINETNFNGKRKKDNIDIDLKVIEKFMLGIKEFKLISWDEKLEKVKKYIDENNKRPSLYDIDKNIKSLAIWIHNREQFYKNKKNCIENNVIYNYWNNFINKYKVYFLKQNDKININLQEIEDYIIKYNKIPLKNDNDKHIKYLGNFIISQEKKYNKNIFEKDDNYNTWYEFTKKYEMYFSSNEKMWLNNIKLVENYIMLNKKIPSSHDKDSDIKSIGRWFITQKSNYITKSNILKNTKFYSIWENFIKQNNLYIL
jgi:hypothetical protein